MDLFLQQVAYGLVIGSTYAVVALGFALASSVLRVIHFAHPDIFMIGIFGGLVAANTIPGGGLVVALIGGGRGRPSWAMPWSAPSSRHCADATSSRWCCGGPRV